MVIILTCVKELLVNVSVDGEISDGGFVRDTLAHGAARQPHVVTRAQDEDGLHSVGVDLSETGWHVTCQSRSHHEP